MRPSRIILLLVALLAGGLAAYLATQGGNSTTPEVAVTTREIVVEEKKAQILVATGPIGVGQRLGPDTVAWADWPEGALRTGYITIASAPDALEKITGAVSRFEIFPGDPILEDKLVRAQQGYLSAVLPKGKRGVSVAVQADSASGGFIVPNDRVDVVLTRTSGSGQMSETILSNVKVLAIGARLGETGTTGAPENPDDPRAEVFVDRAIATLELDPAQGETIINASKVGTLSLALRSIEDFEDEPTRSAATTARRSGNQAVRVIRFGMESNVNATSSPRPETPVVAPANFSAPERSNLTISPNGAPLIGVTPKSPLGVGVDDKDEPK